MRTQANTKREKAICAAVLDVLAAQIVSEAEHNAVAEEREADALLTYARGIRNVAESLFIKSQPDRRGRG